jgi:ATP-binding cassette, subfamily B, bacterial
LPARSLPAAIRALATEKSSGGQILLAGASDLTREGWFGDNWLVLAGERVLIFSGDGAQEPQVLRELSLKDISEVKIESLVGGSVLQAMVNGQALDLLYYSPALSKQFSDLRGQLAAILKDQPRPEIEEATGRCPTCGLVLGEGTQVCPRCLSKGAVLFRLISYTQPYRKQLVLLGLLMLVSTGFSLLPPYFTKILLDRVLIPRREFSLLPWLVLGLAGSSILGTVLGIFRGRVAAYLSNRVVFDLRAALYERLQWLSLRFFDRHPTGSIISRITKDTDGVQEFLSVGLPWLIICSLTIVGVAAFLFVINWLLALIALLPIPALSFIAYLFRRPMARLYNIFWFRWSRFMGLVNDVFARIKTIKIFSQEPAELQRFRLRNRDVYEAMLKAEQTWATVIPLMEILIGGGSFLVWYFGGQMIFGKALTVGDLMAFLLYLGMIYTPLNSLIQISHWAVKCLSASDRIFEALDAEGDNEKGKGYFLAERVQGGVEFRNVTFGYNKATPILKNISFRVEPGQMLGLVGKSGAGKTTIINLLCRFYDPDEGEILIDGRNLQDYDLPAYRARLGAVLQEAFLLSGTVLDNIAYGKPEATLEEIMKAAKIANAHDFIVGKPDGYDEQVGEKGGRLSAGEKQRVCIARGILHDPAILILDEATANVDLETEDQIQQAISRLIAGRTTFAIAHRLSTLRNAHRLLVLANGEVAEFGSHEELALKKEGVYRRLLEIHRKTSRIRAWDE